MIKNTTAQVVYQTVYVVLAAFGLLNSLGYFAADYNENFYVYYTNLSNYICMGVMFITWINTCKRANRRQEGCTNVAPTFTFLCVILILVTFLVYNFLLAGDHTVVTYFTTQSNLLLHAILPVMFVVHWLCFCEHPTLRWYHPLLSIVMPLVYVVLIVIRAQVLPQADVRYPYFFLDIDTLGVGGFLTWVAVLLVIFIAIGYLLFGVDRAIRVKEKGKGSYEKMD